MAVVSDGSAIYYSPDVSTRGEIRKAQPENGPAQPFAYVAQSRIPFVPQGYVLSPDDRWLTMPLKDAPRGYAIFDAKQDRAIKVMLKP